ncbi:MAG TPA: FecR family protein [Burkholderiales bacterium]|nr:FecR family protein [Burkholderiales bacterium]
METGSVVITGPKSLVVLRFDDGHAVALNENAEFKVTQYTYAKDDAAQDKSVIELLKGAMRSITGLIAQRTPAAYELRIPQATIGIRGTDFMVALVNPAYMSVLNGTIAVTNSAGVATFTAGATATVTSATTLATAIPASALPASVATSFSELSSLSIAAGAAGTGTGTAGGAGGGAGAAAASGAAAGGLTIGTISAIAAAIGVAAAVTSSQESSPISGTTGTTGTR